MTKPFNVITVQCVNKDCARHKIPRQAALPIVGNGLYLNGSVYCECGFVTMNVPTKEQA